MRPGAAKYTLFFLLALLCATASAQFLNQEWGRQAGGAGAYSIGRSVATDADGNVYTTGTFYGTIDFDPGPATFMLAATNSNNVFISKLDAAGNFVWAKMLGNHYKQEYPTSIAVSKSGSIYVAGIFSDTLDIDPGPATQLLYVPFTPAKSTFLLKLSSNGDFMWAGQWGGDPGTCHVSAVRLDSLQNVYLTGYISGRSIDLDPGPGSSPETSFQSGNGAWQRTSLILKLDSAGKLLWKQTDSFDETLMTTSVDAGGNIAGIKHVQWIGALSFSSQLFAERYSPGGTLLWKKELPTQLHQYDYGIATDQLHNVITSGVFAKPSDLDPGPGVAMLHPAGDNVPSLFVLKLDANGNFLWVRQIDRITSGGYSMTDADGNIYVAGTFSGTVDFDPGPDLFRLNAAGLNSYLLKLGPAGNFLWVQQFGKGTPANIYDLCQDKAGNFYTTGTFTGTVNFNPGNGPADMHTCEGPADAFTSKLSASGLLAMSVKDPKLFASSIFPNPTEGSVNLVFNEQLERPEVRVSDMAGKVVLETSYFPSDWFKLDLSALASGMYVVTVTDGIRVLREKLIKE